MAEILDDNEALANEIAKLRDGAVKNIIMNDDLILEYANFELEKIMDMTSSSKDHDCRSIDAARRDDLRAELRRLGSYVSAFRAKYKEPLTLTNTFEQRYEKYIHEAVGKCTNGYALWHLARKINALLKKVLVYAVDEMGLEGLISQYSLNHQIDLVNVRKRKTRAKTPARRVASGVLPTFEDVRKLQEHVDEQLETFKGLSKKTFKYKHYAQYCKYTITSIVMYNLCGSVEVSAMTEEQFLQREKIDPDTLPLDQMTEEEKQLAMELGDIYVVSLGGKRENDQGVFAILQQITYKAIRRLLIIKKNFPNLKGNNYVFATKGEQKLHVRGNKSLEFISNKLGVENITAAKLSKAASIYAHFESDQRRKNVLSRILEGVMTQSSIEPEIEMDNKCKRVTRSRTLSGIEASKALPNIKHVQKLQKHIDEQLMFFYGLSKKTFDYEQYLEYCKYTITSIVMFNLCRSGEVAAMSEMEFHQRKKIDPDTLPLEEDNELYVVSLGGNGKSENDQCRFAILHQTTENAIHRLRIIKKNFPNLNGNYYAFAIERLEKMHIREKEAFEFVAKRLSLENITAGKLRQYFECHQHQRRKKLLSSILAHES